MHRTLRTLAVGAAALLLSAPSPSPTASTMNFFITSAGPGDGANLGGLAGADRHCTALAAAVKASQTTWRAYLSAKAMGDQPAVNAKDRIGTGPFFNSKGVQVAKDVAELHAETNGLGKDGSLNEKGEKVNGRGDTPNMHDILTGSNPDGTLAIDTLDTTCNNWTSNAASPASAFVGHHDKQGGGMRPTSWNSAHASRGCGQANLQATGGNGLYYCFGM
jgi:hypothetical protein